MCVVRQTNCELHSQVEKGPIHNGLNVIIFLIKSRCEAGSLQPRNGDEDEGLFFPIRWPVEGGAGTGESLSESRKFYYRHI